MNQGMITNWLVFITNNLYRKYQQFKRGRNWKGRTLSGSKPLGIELGKSQHHEQPEKWSFIGC